MHWDSESLRQLCSSDSTAPYCATWVYTDIYSGYTGIGCNNVATTVYIGYSPGAKISSSATSIRSLTRSTGSTSSSSSTRASTTSTLDPRPSQANIFAIVGGIVGGVAVLAVLVLGLVFTLRRKRKNAGHLTPDAPPSSAQRAFNGPHPGGFTPQSAMQQQFAQAQPLYGGGADPGSPAHKGPYSVDAQRQSMYEPSMASSPGSLVPHPPGPVASAVPNYSQVAPQNMAPGSAHRYQQQQQQQVPQHQTRVAHEVPATRADSELRELP